MPTLLRKVKHNRWLREPALQWLNEDDIPSDPLADLNTSEQTLSVWEVADDESNVQRIVRNLALMGNKTDSSGYVLFDSAILEQIGIDLVRADGHTPDTEANGWHRDLVNLSGKKLVALARAVLAQGTTRIVLKKRICELIIEGVAAKQIAEKFRDRAD
jgi:hypothetical protein